MMALERLADVSARVAAPGALMNIAGTVTEVTPTAYRVRGLSPFSRLGDCVALQTGNGQRHGEVVRIDPESVMIKPYATTGDVELGTAVTKAERVTISPAASWKGRVLDAMGTPIDGAGPPEIGPERRSIYADPPPALDRGRVKAPIKTGVRVLDIFTPLCQGQRIGIFAGSGVGKSTLLGMLAAGKGFRQRRHRACGRAWPRGARIHRGFPRREPTHRRHGRRDR